MRKASSLWDGNEIQKEAKSCDIFGIGIDAHQMSTYDNKANLPDKPLTIYTATLLFHQSPTGQSHYNWTV